MKIMRATSQLSPGSMTVIHQRNLHGGMILPTDIPHYFWHCCKVSDEVAFSITERPYISKTLLTRRIIAQRMTKIKCFGPDLNDVPLKMPTFKYVHEKRHW
ncbi:TPA: hypothetical protein ACIUGV_003839 [Salmonella enterica subsp. enterica serovar Bahrenfeld]